MLKELCIRDFKLLRDVTLAFQPGLTVLTGETGAGKTQCLEALTAALGARAGDDVISKDSDQAVLTVVFDLRDRADIVRVLEREGWLEDGETEIIIERTVERGGRSRGRLNGRRVPIGTLQAVSDRIVDLLGQNARADILNRPALEVLDSLGDQAHQEKLARVRKRFDEWRTAAAAFDRERDEIARASERKELAEFQHSELEKADLKPGEEKDLTKEAELLESARERSEDALKAASLLQGESEDAPNARDLLQEALDCIERLASTDDALKGEAFRLREMVFLADELADTLKHYATNIVDDPERRAWVEERLGALNRLQRKYKTDEAGLIELRDRLAAELERVEYASERLEELAALRDKARGEYLTDALELSKSRRRLAKRVSKEIRTHLADLDLPAAKFEVDLESRPEDESAYRGDGIDAAELLISTNPAQDLGPLRKIASGGELSRLLMALKTVLAGRDRVPVLVFDEAEAGIGGETAFRVGEKLVELSRSHQLIVVSHLPQIASQAAVHWVIEKSTKGSGARASARNVSGDERVREIGRMLGARGDREALEKLARSFLKGA